MFSKACEYGIRSLIFITSKSMEGERVNLTEISEAIDSPSAFTAKILQQLTRNNIVSSIKGPHGGFYIEMEAMKTLNLSAVVKVLDGDDIYTGCGLGLKQCNEDKPCPLHFKFVDIREKLKYMLENTTLIMLANDMELDIFHLKT